MSRALKILKTIVSGGRDVRCEACGNAFECGVSLKGCWCSDVKLSDLDREALRAKYSDCLCRECLEKLAVAKAEPSQVQANDTILTQAQ